MILHGLRRSTVLQRIVSHTRTVRLRRTHPEGQVPPLPQAREPRRRRSKQPFLFNHTLPLRLMARRKRVYKKIELRDSRFDSPLVAKFITRLMAEGKRAIAERIVYAAIDKVNEKSEAVDPLEIVTRAVENAKPRLEVKARRVGGATYQVPLEVSKDRRNTLAIRWIVTNARNRSEKTMTDRLVGELLDSQSGRGGAMKKREDVHRMAEANKAFAHYRF